MYPGIESRLLRYAVAVADELHFRRAAEKLNVAQPSLSKQIRELEDELGGRLFDRTSREVRLTKAGEAFVTEARQSLLHNERAVQVARARMRPESLVIGYSPNISLDLLSKINTLSRSHFPNLEITLISAFTGEQIDAIRVGEMDAGVVILPVAADGLAVQPLLSEPLMIVLPEQHSLRRRKSISLRELEGERFIAVHRRQDPGFYTQVQDACAEQGLKLQVIQDVTTMPEALAMVADGVGIAFSRACFERSKLPGVVFRRIEDEPLVMQTGLAHRVAGRPDALPSLVAVLRDRKGTDLVTRRPPRRAHAGAAFATDIA